MNWMEAALLVLGIGAFVASFCLPERNKKEEEQEKTIDPEIIRSLVEKELADAKEKVSEVVDETLEYAVEKTERASERISNEKIMAINEYSDTVLADMNKTHQEIMFLYDMLNDKHKNLKETVQQVDKTAKEAEEKANAAANALAVKEEKKTETKKETTTKMYVSSTTINVREKASTSSKIIKQLGINTEVTVVEKVDNTWSKISIDGTQGYVATKYLSSKKTQTTSNNSTENKTATSRGSDETRTSNNSTTAEETKKSDKINRSEA